MSPHKSLACLVLVACLTNLVHSTFGQDTVAPPAQSTEAAPAAAGAPASTPPASGTEAPGGKTTASATIVSAAPLPIELRPYRVEVALTFADSPRLTSAFQQAVIDEFKGLVDRSIGPMWDMQIGRPSWLTPRNRQGVARLTVAGMKERFAADNVDKCYPVSIEFIGSEFVLSSREWCRESWKLSPVSQTRTLDRAFVATELLRLVHRLFRPIANLDDGDGNGARLRVRAGELTAGDPAFDQSPAGSVFVPYMRNLDKDKKVTSTNFIPWCYLSPEEVKRSRLECRMDAGVAMKFSSKKRVEWKAMALRPAFPTTELAITLRNSTKPLVGYLLAVYDEPPPPPPAENAAPAKDGQPAKAEEKPTTPAPDPARLLLRTDRFGKVHVPAKPEHPLQWVYIRSGREVLTRFPIVPGADQSLTAPCPDDTMRLDVEGQIALLESELVDTIAKRAVTMALINARSKKNEWTQVDEGFAELTKLPKYPEFEKKVGEIQFPAIKRAQSKKNLMAEDRIKKLGAKVLEIAKFHLDEEKITELKEDLAEARKIAKEETETQQQIEELNRKRLNPQGN